MTKTTFIGYYGFVLILSAIIMVSCNKDSEPPVITILGSNPFTNCIIQLPDTVIYSEYNDEGATAYDAEDGDLTSAVSVSSNVDIYQTGSYHVTYSVKDKAGNEAIASRIVIVEFCK
jgi:hypothetical protein